MLLTLKLTYVLFIISLLINKIKCNDNLKVAYEWKQIDFEYENLAKRQEAITTKSYIPENVIPVGLEVYRDRLFLTLPRWKNGVPASLGYLDLNDNSTKSPKLKPFPSWQAHQLNLTTNEIPEIISPFRIRADKCGRLWILDTGIVNVLGTSTILSPTQLLVYDLHNDNLLRRFSFPNELLKENSFFANIAVEDSDCEDTYAYSADLGAPGLVVYSWKMREAWKVNHHYFHPDPLAGNFSINGFNFQWDDGLFGISISKPQPDGNTTLYFHPLSSTMEFAVSTSVLKNKTLATSNDIYREFKILGSRGVNAQAGASFLDQLTGVLFYALPNLNAVACWKTSNRAYTIKSQGRVYMNPVEMIFPNDVKVDDKDNLWVLSDRLHLFMNDRLDENDINFRILTAYVHDAIENTACDTKTKPFPDLINKLGDILRPSTTMSPNKNNSAYHLPSSLFILLLFLSVAKLLV